MKRSKFLLTVLLIPFLSYSQYILEEGFIGLESFDKVETYFTFKNLRLYPLTGGENFQAAHCSIGQYTNLEEALNEGKVLITEKTNEVQENNESDFIDPQTNSDYIEFEGEQPQMQNREYSQAYDYGGEVNKLYIENTSNDTVYLMAGEVIKGGKQDRVLAQDMIIPPVSGKTELPVFCVEHHRWAYGSSDHSFKEYYAVSSNSIRGKAVMEKSQQDVWDAVEDITTKQGGESSTGTYAGLENSVDYNETLKKYLDVFVNKLALEENFIGFVGVTGDRIIGCDIFATPELFEKQSKNLLNAYITEAITDGSEIVITDKEVKDYLEGFLSDESTQDEVVRNKGMQFEHKGKKLHLNTY